MLVVRKAAALIFSCIAGSVCLPGTAAALHIEARVEQPAYAGMPVWLDVVADEPCIEAVYQGDLSGYASGGQAQVTADGKPAQAGFRPTSYIRSEIIFPPGTCPSVKRYLKGGTHRIPLHLIADLREPGTYAVRWIVPKTTQFGAVKPTEWLQFTVASADPVRRESWLTGLLRRTPKDPETVRDDYVPSLLAAWPDPRAERRVLELMCSDDVTVTSSADDAFHPALPADAQMYLAQLVSHGCLSQGLVTYVNHSVGVGRDGVMPEGQRVTLLTAAVKALPAAHGDYLAHAIEVVSLLKNGSPSIPSPAADAAVLRKAPEILAATEGEKSATDDPKWLLINYLGGRNPVPGGHAVLKALAAQNDDAAAAAVGRLLELGDPADIPFLRDRMMRAFPDDLESQTLQRDFETMRMRFGPAATGLMENLTRAKMPRVAVAASLTLDSEGDRFGTSAVLDALRNGRHDKETELLNQIIETTACPDENDDCHEEVSRSAQLQEPWAQARKAAAVRYFEARLAGGK